jgi:predicted RNase H-like HicB family nuclease
MLDYMKDFVQFHVFEDEDGGYVAEGIELAVVTQGDTLDELVKNLREATELALEGEDLAKLDLVPHPKISANIELAISLDAKA